MYFEAVATKPKQNTGELVLHSVALSTVLQSWCKAVKNRASSEHSHFALTWCDCKQPHSNGKSQSGVPLACRTSLAFQESAARQLFTNLEVRLWGCTALAHTALDVRVYQCDLPGL